LKKITSFSDKIFFCVLPNNWKSKIKVVCLEIYQHTDYCKVYRSRVSKKAQKGANVVIKEYPKGLLRQNYLPFYGADSTVKMMNGCDRLQREIEILSVVADCPGVVRLLDVKISRNYVKMIYNYCGQQLMEFFETGVYIRTGGSGANSILYSIEETVAICLQMIDVLKFLKTKKIVHRDIRPQNIMILREKVALIDFEFASFVEDDGKIYDSQGSFLPPEAAQGVPQEGICGFARDLWSLGITVCCMLTGYSKVSTEVPKWLSSDMLHPELGKRVQDLDQLAKRIKGIRKLVE
jgi:serine/threonine protein kinase